MNKSANKYDGKLRYKKKISILGVFKMKKTFQFLILMISCLCFLCISMNFSDAYLSIQKVVDDDFVVDRSQNRIAVIESNYGIIKFELYEQRAPITTANFIKLAEEKFYDGIKFHRIIDDFVIQTGDPNTRDDNPYNDGNGGSDETIPLEIHPDLTHEDGAVGMARSQDPDSASSQFYICDEAQHGLDGDYAVFGIVIEGIEVVREIAQAETYPDYRVVLKDHPIDDIVMFQVYIIPPINSTNDTAADISDNPKPEKRSPLPGFDAELAVIAIAAVVIVFTIYRKHY